MTPYIHTDETHNSHAKIWLAAIAPILVWSIYMFGARVLSLCVTGAVFALLLDYPVQRFVFKRERGARLDIMAAVYAVLAVFSMPVAVSLWLPIISSLLVVIAKNLRVIRKKRLFNPFVFSAAVMSLAFKSQMTMFTRPFAYFSAFSINLDSALVDGYRVISPLQYMADGSVYEDGVIAQIYGFASGNIGEIAVAAIVIAFVWMIIRKQADWKGTLAFLVPILLLALALPSDDAESNYYAYSVLLSGGIIFLSVFAMSEKQTLPLTDLGRIIFGAVCGIAIFFLRKYAGGFEWGYFVILAMNILSPFIEMLTKPKTKKKKA